MQLHREGHGEDTLRQCHPHIEARRSAYANSHDPVGFGAFLARCRRRLRACHRSARISPMRREHGWPIMFRNQQQRLPRGFLRHRVSFPGSLVKTRNVRRHSKSNPCRLQPTGMGRKDSKRLGG